MASVRDVQRHAGDLSDRHDLAPEELEAILCPVAPIFLELVRRVARDVADDQFVLVRWIVRRAVDAVLALLEQWVEDRCNSVST